MGVTIRKATEKDCDLLFRWVNDPDVRKNAFNTDEISFDSHVKWFQKMLFDMDCFICIAYIGDIPIGQVRINVDRDMGIIDYSIDKDFRGRGYGKIILEAILNEVLRLGIPVRKLVGKVKFENIPSQKAFIKAGYDCKQWDHFYEFSKNL